MSSQLLLRWYLCYCIAAGIISIILGILVGAYFIYVPDYIIVPGVVVEEPLTT